MKIEYFWQKQYTGNPLKPVILLTYILHSEQKHSIRTFNEIYSISKRPYFTLQKGIFHTIKDGLLQRNMPPFRKQPVYACFLTNYYHSYTVKSIPNSTLNIDEKKN